MGTAGVVRWVSTVLLVACIAAWVAAGVSGGVLLVHRFPPALTAGLLPRHTMCKCEHNYYHIPIAWLVIASAAMSWVSWAAWARRRRVARDGACSVCAYNLTGNVSGVCPECGTATVAGRPEGGKTDGAAETAA